DITSEYFKVGYHSRHDAASERSCHRGARGCMRAVDRLCGDVREPRLAPGEEWRGDVCANSSARRVRAAGRSHWRTWRRQSVYGAARVLSCGRHTQTCDTL